MNFQFFNFNRTAFISCLLILVCNVTVAQSVASTDGGGPPEASVVPIGWVNVNGTMDTANLTRRGDPPNAGWEFFASPSVVPPNGHNFYLWGVTNQAYTFNNTLESASTTITGLISGKSYTIVAYVASARFLATYVSPTTAGFLVDGVEFSVTGVTETAWTQVPITFTATGSTAVLQTGFTASTLSGVLFSVSSISLTCNAGTEAPKF